jgi:preprotein translocase subunit SecE
MAATDNQVGGGSLLASVLSVSLYKRNQGRLARQVTFAALALVLGVGAWRLAQIVTSMASGDSSGAADLGVVRFVVPGAMIAFAAWLSFRIVNIPRFAEFLIAVEAEMAKVSWPSGTEVFRSSVVVIFLIFFLAALLAGFDFFWWFLLHPQELLSLIRGGSV